MDTYFTVVRFVPDPVADERVNIGVVVFGGGRVLVRFLDDWTRVEAFAQQDVTLAREFADRMERMSADTQSGMVQLPFGSIPVKHALAEEELRRMFDEWGNLIQFAPVEPAEEAPEVLVADLADLVLKETEPRRRNFRDQRVAAGIAVKTVRQAFEERFGPSRSHDLVRERHEIKGRWYPRNKTDVAVANGRYYLAARAISFEIERPERIEQQAREVILTLGDLRTEYRDLELGVVALEPREGAANYRRARDLYSFVERACAPLGAQLVPEADAARWADQLAERLAPQLIGHSRGSGATSGVA